MKTSLIEILLVNHSVKFDWILIAAKEQMEKSFLGDLAER